MDCIMNTGAFIRSNGDWVCWDDAGCNNTIQEYAPDIDWGHDVYLGRPYQDLRNDLMASKMPQGHTCSSCLAMNTDAIFQNTSNRITYLQVESAFSCQLACSNCYPDQNRKAILPARAGGHMLLKLDTFKKQISDLYAAGIEIDVLEFQGHGEPLVNKNIWDMIEFSRELYPNNEIRIVTNANFKFEDHMIKSGVTQIYFSIDGVSQETYIPYRKRGNFDKAISFLNEFCAAAKENGNIKTVWKYILFEHNSKPEHLEKLYEIAEAAGVDEVQLIITQMGPSSRTFFDMILNIWNNIKNKSSAEEIIRDIHTSTDLSKLAPRITNLIGKSVFPDRMVSSALPIFKLHAYTSHDLNLDMNMLAVRKLLSDGDAEGVGEAISAIANKIWRLYDGKSDMIIDQHIKILSECASISEYISHRHQLEFCLKYEPFFSHIYDQSNFVSEAYIHPEGSATRATGNIFTVAESNDSLVIMGKAPHGGRSRRLQFAWVAIEGTFHPKIQFEFFHKPGIQVHAADVLEKDIALIVPPDAFRVRLFPGSEKGVIMLKDVKFDLA